MLFHQTRQISPSSKYSPHTLLQKMHLTPLFIPAFPAPFTNASPSFLTTFHAMIKAYTVQILRIILRIYVLTLLRYYRSQPNKISTSPPALHCKHCSENEPSFLPSTLQSPPPQKRQHFTRLNKSSPILNIQALHSSFK